MVFFRVISKSLLLKRVDFITWVGLSLKLFTPVVLLPLMVTSYTSEEVVMWLSFSMILQFFLYIDFGFTPVITRFFAYANKGENRENELKFIWLASGYVNRFLLLLGFVGFFVGFFSGNLADKLGYWGYISLIFSFSFLIKANKYKAAIEGVGQVQRLRLIELFSNSIQMISIFIAILLELEIKFLLFFVAMSYLPYLILVWIFKPEIFKRISVTLNGRDDKNKIKSTCKTLFSQSWKGGVSLILSLGVSSFIVLFASSNSDSLISLLLLIVFNYSRTGYNMCLVPLYNQIAHLSGLFSSGNLSSYRQHLKESCMKVGLLFIVFSMLFLLCLPVLVQFLAPEIHELNYWLIVTLLFAVFAERLQAMLMQAYATANLIVWHWNSALYGIGSLLFMLFFLYFEFDKVYSLIASMLAASFITLFKIIFIDFSEWKKRV